MKTMTYIFSITAMLLLACAKDKPIPEAQAQNYDCWEITVNDSLFNYLANLTEAPFGSKGYPIVESTYGPVEFKGTCLFIPIAVGGDSDMEYKLVWNGQITNNEMDVYLHVIHHYHGPEMATLKHERIYFDFKQGGKNLKVKFHYYDQYYKEF